MIENMNVDVIDRPDLCDDDIVEVKSRKYRGYDIYAVRRKIADMLFWCGYVVIDKESINRLCAGKKCRKKLTAVADQLFIPHGGFTYTEHGIDFLDTNDAVFGWDYNHALDRERGYTWLDVIVCGMAVVDSLA